MSFRDGNLPAASSPAAIDAVFEMAREMAGAFDAPEAESLRAWLEVARRYVKHSAQRIEHLETTTTVERVIVSNAAPPRHCSLCGVAGHRMTTCALNPDRIEVEEP